MYIYVIRANLMDKLVFVCSRSSMFLCYSRWLREDPSLTYCLSKASYLFIRLMQRPWELATRQNCLAASHQNLAINKSNTALLLAILIVDLGLGGTKSRRMIFVKHSKNMAFGAKMSMVHISMLLGSRNR